MRYLVLLGVMSCGGGSGGDGACPTENSSVRTPEDIDAACEAKCDTALACRPPGTDMDFEDFACTGDCNEYFSFAANSPTCNVLIDAIVACYERIDCTAFATNDVQTATDMACADEIACAEPCFGDGPFP